MLSLSKNMLNPFQCILCRKLSYLNLDLVLYGKFLSLHCKFPCLDFPRTAQDFQFLHLTWVQHSSGALYYGNDKTVALLAILLSTTITKNRLSLSGLKQVSLLAIPSFKKPISLLKNSLSSLHN